ncbi:MAG: FtsQ-type POTRA domain-containing protein [Chloroflexota bacterium]|nr:FtsQ-type POTRA domain-containing protein [Chloroflexota bacterium]
MVGKRRASRSRARLDGTGEAASVSGGGSLLHRVNWSKALALVLLLVNVWFMYRFLASSRFCVQEVIVKGQERVSGEEVENVANVLGRNAFHIQTSKLERRIEEQFGCVKQSSVHCKLPSKVVITLEERQDILVWASGERYWWVDKDGNVLGPAADPSDCVVVRDVRGWAPAPQGRLIDVPWALVWDVVEALPAARSYEYVPNIGLVLRVTDHSWPVYLGYDGDAELKVMVMRELVQGFLEEDMQIEYIDVRNGRRPSYGKL